MSVSRLRGRQLCCSGSLVTTVESRQAKTSSVDRPAAVSLPQSRVIECVGYLCYSSGSRLVVLGSTHSFTGVPVRREGDCCIPSRVDCRGEFVFFFLSCLLSNSDIWTAIKCVFICV